jgi:hypothetical protein
MHARSHQVVSLWREDLSKINAKAAESLADPAQYPNLFPNLDLALHAETYQARDAVLPAIEPLLFGGLSTATSACACCYKIVGNRPEVNMTEVIAAAGRLK